MSLHRGALSDLRVLDLAGPDGWYCTKLLADLGADVIRIEPPGGDPGRRRPPFQHDDPSAGRSLAFWYFNTSKRSEVLDLTGAEGRARFRELALDADVVVETGRPGAFDELGIGYRQLSRDNPGLVWTAITPFGQTGPYAGWKANDLVVEALGGLMFLAGVPTSPPSQLGGNQAEYQAGVLAACGTLLGLAERETSERGQLVDISGQAAIAIDAENALAYWDVNGVVKARSGDRNLAGLRNFFETKDGWVYISMGNRWAPLRRWLDALGLLTPDLTDPKWESSQYRGEHPEEIEQLCRRLSSHQTRQEMYLAGQQARVGVGPIYRIDELFDDPQLAARGFWQSIPHPEIEQSITYPGAPFRLSHSPWRIRRRPPLPGEHNGEGWLPSESTDPGQPASTAYAGQAGGSTGEVKTRRRPLEGVRIVDLSWVAAAPLATRLLASFGAEVIKVESNVHPDSARRQPMPRPPGNDSLNVGGMWNNLNVGKASVSLDLRDPEALAQLERLIAQADVLVDNYGVDPYPRWGFTTERLRELRPDLIVARSSVMGRTGPRQHFIGFGYTIGAAAGHNSITGFPGDPPVGACIAHPDYSCNPFHFALAILAALHFRTKTGIGQTIDLSQHESTVCWIGPELLDYTVNGRVAGPNANRRPDAAPHGAYRTSAPDRWLAIACESEEEFASLCKAMGRPDLAADSRFQTLAARKANEDELDAEVSRWTGRMDAEEAMYLLQAAGVAAGVVRSHRELVEQDPQMLHRGQYLRLDHPEAGLRLADAPPILLSRTPGILERAAPLLGEDNERILRDLLGLSEEELANGYVGNWVN